MRKVTLTKKAINFNEETEDFSSLSQINGIGKKTIDDIKKIYTSVEQLKLALKENNCPLRDDQVIKLKEYFEI